MTATMAGQSLLLIAEAGVRPDTFYRAIATAISGTLLETGGDRGYAGV